MANYHLHTKVISRAKNKSALAAAAYRSAENLFSEVDQKMKRSRKNKEKIRHKEIFTPEDAPGWASDRASLWNGVELHEHHFNRKRKTARLAREVEASLPRELDMQTNIQLARDFVHEQFVSLGMVADLAVHEGIASDGQPNVHFHVMLTLRDISENGFGDINRDWNRKVLLRTWREAWQEKVNAALEQAGSSARVSHESYEARDINKTPQPKIGHTAAAMEARGAKTDRMEAWHLHRFNALSEAGNLPKNEAWYLLELMDVFIDEPFDRESPEL